MAANIDRSYRMIEAVRKGSKLLSHRVVSLSLAEKVLLVLVAILSVLKTFHLTQFYGLRISCCTNFFLSPFHICVTNVNQDSES